MEITKVSIHKVNREDSAVKGYASVTLDDCFMIENIRIIQGKNRLFCAMPSRPRKNGEESKFEDVAHPTNEETRKYFEDTILNEYNRPEESEEN